MRLILRFLIKPACCFVGLWLFTAAAQAGMGLPERITLLTERIAAAPTDQSLYLRRALIYSDTGEFKLAMADVDAAAQFGPGKSTYFVKAILLYRLGQPEQALPLLKQFIEAHPRDAEAIMYRARVQRDAGATEAALADYLRYLKLNAKAEPPDYLTAAQLMMQLADSGHRQYSRSKTVAFLDARIAQLGVAPQLQRYAIEIEQQNCQSQQVLQRLQQLPEEARHAPQWPLQMAEQHLLRGEADAARAQLATTKALLDTRRPTNDKARLTHQYNFARELLALPANGPGRSPRIDAIYRQYYPAKAPATRTTVTTGAAATTPKNWADFEQFDVARNDGSEVVAVSENAAAQPHPPLAAFERPKPVMSGYEPAWAEPVQAFYGCLKGRKPKSR